MDLYDVMRTTFACREFTDDPVPDAVLAHIFEKKAPVVLVFCVDLQVVASTDKNLERVGVISGGSIYPFVWNALLAARNEGFGGTITTLAVAQEPKLQQALNIPSHVAIAAIVPLGKPAKQLSKLRRRPVEDIVRLERFDGAPFKG